MTTFPTARAALMGNPPQPGYEPRKQDLVNVLEQMQAIAAVEMLKDFHGAAGDLPAQGNATGDKRAVLAAEGDGGGVHEWDGAAWQLIAALPVVLTESLSAMDAAASAELSQAWAAGTEPGGAETRSALEWAALAQAWAAGTEPGGAETRSALEWAGVAGGHAEDAAGSATVAQTAADLAGIVLITATKAEADAALGGLAEGAIVEVSVDETEANQRTRYRVETGVLVLLGTPASVSSSGVTNQSAVTGATVTAALNTIKEGTVPPATITAGTGAAYTLDPGAGLRRLALTAGNQYKVRVHADGTGAATLAVTLASGTTGAIAVQRYVGDTLTALVAGDLRESAHHAVQYNGTVWVLLDNDPVRRRGDDLIGGYTITTVDDGTKSTGTYTPTLEGGNGRKIINGGAFTLAAPSIAGTWTAIIHITNNATAGAITFSGFAADGPGGDDLTTTDTHEFRLHLTSTENVVTGYLEALQ